MKHDVAHSAKRDRPMGYVECIPTLTLDSTTQAFYLAKDLMDDGLWSKGSIEQGRRHARITSILALGYALLDEYQNRWFGIDLKGRTDHIATLLSDLALELSEHAMEAQADGGIRFGKHDSAPLLAIRRRNAAERWHNMLNG